MLGHEFSRTGVLAGGSAARSPRGRSAVVLAALAAAVLLGVLLGRASVADQPARPPADGAARAIVDGVPVEHPRTRAGAVAAAADYAQALSQAALVGEERLLAAQQQTFTAHALRMLGAEVRQQARTARAALELAGRGRSTRAATQHAPLAARVLRLADGQAEVALWSVDLSTAGPHDTAQALWMTERLALVWEDGRWRIAGARAASGPVPRTAQRQPSAPGVLHEQLRTTRLLRHAG